MAAARKSRKRLYAIMAVMMAAVILLLFLIPREKTAEQHFAAAGVAFDAGDLRTARIELLNAIKLKPKWPAAHLAQAETLLGLFDGRNAELSARRAIAAGAEEAEAAPYLAHALWLQGKPEDAIALLEQSDILDKDRGYAERIAGRAYIDMGDLESAGQAFDAALERTPDSSLLWADIAFYRWRSGDMAGAREAAGHAIDLNPRDVRAIQMRGELERRQRGLVPSLAWFAQGLETAPNDVPLLVEYGSTLGEAGRHREMLAVARHILTLDGRNGRAFMMQAVIAARAGEATLARTLLDKAGGAANSPAGWMLRGLVEYREGNFNHAFEAFDRLLGAQPYNRKARRLAALSLYRAGDLNGAKDLVGPLLAGQANNYDAMLAGRIFEALGEEKPATEALTAAGDYREPGIERLYAGGDAELLARDAAKSPNDASAVIPYLRMLAARGNPDAALDSARRLSARFPGVVEAQLLVGDLEYLSGNSDGALASYRRAADLAFSEPVMLRLVETLENRGDLAEADRLAREYLAANPASLPARHILFRHAMARSDWPSAIMLGESLRRRGVNRDFALLANLARAYVEAGDSAAAVPLARRAYQLQPASALTTHVYGYALLRVGERARDSVTMLQKAAILSPDNDMLRYHLASAYAAAGASERAERLLATALSNPDFPDRDKAVALYRKLTS